MNIEYAILFTKIRGETVSRNLGNTIYPTEELAQAAIMIHDTTPYRPARRTCEVVSVVRSVESQ